MSREPESHRREFPIPTSPVIIAALRAIYAGGRRNRWLADSFGRPHYSYASRDGQITVSIVPPPDFGSRLNFFKAQYGYALRHSFAHAGSLRAEVQKFSVETADVFLILMTRIAELRDPAKDIASASLEEIADFRGVHLRRGSAQNLLRDFNDEVTRLSEMCLTMTWRDYATGGTITVGREKPDHLLDIVDVEHTRERDTRTSFRFRCGQALSHFLSSEGLRWIGYYNPSLLRLSPYHDAFTKKIGTYWTIVGVIAGKKGSLPRATPYSILDFCAENINWRNPGQTVNTLIKAHDRLVEIGILSDAAIVDPPNRMKGYFREWLETPIRIRLSDSIWKISGRRGIRLSHNMNVGALPSQVRIPRDAGTLVTHPALIKQFRTDYFLHQAELARALGVKRQTLSKYERGLSRLPKDTASKILRIWQQKGAQK